MLPLDNDLAELLLRSHEVEYRATAFYAGQVKESVIPLVPSQGSLRWDGNAQVQCTGSVFLARDAESLVPKSKADPLAPYGQEIRVDRVDKKGSLEWVTPLGQLRITAVTGMQERFKRYPTQRQMVGWSAQLDLADRFDRVIPDEFLQAQAPQSPTVWGEIQRLSPLPIAANLPDADVPSSLTAYPDSRMEAITQLFALLGAYPHLTRYGVLTGRLKDVWMTANMPVFEVQGVIDIDQSMTNNVSNSVKLSASGGSNDMFAISEITDPGDPLNVNGPMGRRVVRQSTPLLNTYYELKQAADRMLARVSMRLSQTVKLTCLPQPHLELGDYIRVTDPVSGVMVNGEVSEISMPLTPTSSWEYTLLVAEIS
jgi:hypothetical protein